MISRRNMIAGIFAAASAPAIVRASSLMKIWVPPEQRILYPMEIGRIEGFRFIESNYVTGVEKYGEIAESVPMEEKIRIRFGTRIGDKRLLTDSATLKADLDRFNKGQNRWLIG